MFGLKCQMMGEGRKKRGGRAADTGFTERSLLLAMSKRSVWLLSTLLVSRTTVSRSRQLAQQLLPPPEPEPLDTGVQEIKHYHKLETYSLYEWDCLFTRSHIYT